LPIAPSLLIALLATTPLVALVNYDIVRPVLLILIASVAAAVAINAQPDQIAGAGQTLRRFALAMLLPAAWMILQCIPVPFSTIENPIWATTRMALNEPSLAGHISLDPGATMRGAVWYLAVLAVIISTVLITKDRRRAETVLLAVTIVTTFVAAEVLLGQLAPAAAWAPYLAADSNKFGVSALLATFANLAMIAMFMERHLNRAESTFRITAREALKLLPNLCGAAISIAAIVATRQSHLSLLASLGAALMFLIPVVRRLGLPPWPAALLATALITVTGAAILPEARSVGSIDLLKMVDISPTNSLGIDERALSDAPSLGNGVGTYAGISRFYGDIETIGPITPSSTAIAVAIEWGRAALIVLGAIALQLFFFTLRGALGRGRDSFFASLAAASILCVLVSSFANPGLLTPTVQIALAAVVGLGIAQSTGRTSNL
jgi:hypothetical protein